MDSDRYNDKRSHGDQKHQASSNYSDMFSSAKVIADAAQSTFRHDSDKIDRAKVANAAGNLLDAASQYGKLDEKGIGKYVDKAEEYLQKYSSAGSKPGSHGGDGGRPGVGGYGDYSDSSKPSSHGGGGYENQGKTGTQEFMKSDHSDSGSYSSRPGSHEDGGYGSQGRMGSDSGSYPSKQGSYGDDGYGDQGRMGSRPESHGDGGRFGDYMKMAQGFMKKN